MVRFKHLIPASLALSMGMAPATASPAALAGQARSALADDIARLHRSVRRARSIIEMRDADVSVSESKLQGILGEIKSLEKHVSDLLPEADAKSKDENGCDGSTDQVGSAGPSRGNANCSLKAGAATRKPGQKSALQTSRPASSPDAGLFSSGYKAGRLPGAVFDETGASNMAASPSAPSSAASKPNSETTESNDDASTPDPSSHGGNGKGSHGASSNKAEEESASATKEDDSTPPVIGKTPPGPSTPRFLTASPAKPAQQAVVSRKPAATGLASPKDGSRNAGPMTMSLREELTTTTITRTGSSRTTIRITKTRTRTIWLDWRTKSPTTKASRMSDMAKSATPSLIAADVYQDADRNPGRFAIRTKPATSSPSAHGGNQEDVRDASRTSAQTKPATSSLSTGGRNKDDAGAATRTSAMANTAGSSSIVGEASRNMKPATERIATATRAPNFTKASPSVNAQQLADLQRFANSTTRLSVPLRAEREPLDRMVVAQASTSSAPAPAMTTRKRLTLPPSGGEASTSLPPPSGFKTIATRASKRPNETRK